MPSARVECIEIISPIEDEFTSALIVVENFNVIVKNIPWHVVWVETISPRVECWSPEVHSKGLCFLHEINR